MIPGFPVTFEKERQFYVNLMAFIIHMVSHRMNSRRGMS